MNPTIRGFVKKEFLQALRDRRMRLVIFVIPVVQMLVFGWALSNEVKNIRLAVQAPPSDLWTRQVGERAVGSGWFVGVSAVKDPLALLQSGQADAVLMAPAGGMSRGRGRGDGSVQLLVDGTNAIRARAVESYLRAIVKKVDTEQGIELPSGLELDVRALYNPTMATSVYLVPGVMGLILGLITILLTTLSLAREKETGTLETLLAAPVKRWEIFIGKTLPFVLLGVADVPLMVGFGHFVFGVPLRGPLWALGLNAGTYVCAMVAVGTWISTYADNQQQAMMGGFLFLFPAVLLSGVMTPLDNLPFWAKPLAWINPLQYFVALNRQVMLRGVVGPSFWLQWGALVLLGAAVSCDIVRRLRSR